jgi:hypothetical protein
MNRSVIIVFVLVLLSIASVAIWYLVDTSSKAGANNPAVATTTDTVITGDAIYTNGPYGFVIRYPEAALVENTFSSYYHLASSWRATALANATGAPIVSFNTYSTKSDNSYPRYYSALIRIGASADPKEVAQCLKPVVDQAETALPDATIGGIVWKAFAFESAGMQQYVKGASYRVIHEGRCVALEKIAAGSSYRDDPASVRDVPDTELQKQYEALDRITQTFMFVRP